MATLRDIQRRIRSVQSTQKITRAMKLVAAAKLRRAQERVLAARPYAAKMSELLGNLVSAATGSDVHPRAAGKCHRFPDPARAPLGNALCRLHDLPWRACAAATRP